MRRTLRPLVCLIALAALASTGVFAGDDERQAPQPDSPRENVLITITVGGIDGERKTALKTYEMVAISGNPGPRSQLMMGSQVPIPVTTFQASNPPREIVPMTSYTYQKIGFQAQMRARILEDGSIRLEGEIEDSSIRASLRDGRHDRDRPIVDTRQQNLAVRLQPGVPLEITRFTDTTGGSFYMDVTARVLPAGSRAAASRD